MTFEDQRSVVMRVLQCGTGLLCAEQIQNFDILVGLMPPRKVIKVNLAPKMHKRRNFDAHVYEYAALKNPAL